MGSSVFRSVSVSTMVPSSSSSHIHTKEQHDAVPMLLLEGDAFHVNHDGVCRTYYELLPPTTTTTKTTGSPISLVEEYHLKTARKTFTLRQPPTTGRSGGNSAIGGWQRLKHKHKQTDGPSLSLLSQHIEGVVDIGIPLASIEVQEIDQGVFGSAGTGATTWESSLAMSLFYSEHPEFLEGSVLELGSGVGIGGIITALAAANNNPYRTMTSLTLTDGNQLVLDECRRNIRRVARNHNISTSIRVQQLQWEETPPPPTTSTTAAPSQPKEQQQQQYDTILASDCAYRYPDVMLLAGTMYRLLAPKGTIHIFGPYNRGALQHLMVELQQHYNMVVQVNGLEMNRYRLKAALQNESRMEDERESVYASKRVARFLHITATHNHTEESTWSNSRSPGSQTNSLEDID